MKLTLVYLRKKLDNNQRKIKRNFQEIYTNHLNQVFIQLVENLYFNKKNNKNKKDQKDIYQETLQKLLKN